ncbi:MAG: permease [Streptococcaceae bacterium]|jgi:uncharacterized membrane protein YraQ (UPF0718 family)|nr:permease [Streptococcaceae bacterium]
MLSSLPDKVLQCGAIFTSIIIEALPFVLFGCLISGFLQIFLTPEKVRRIVPKNKFLSVLFGCILGLFFPSCECGIVPIVHRLLEKKVPNQTAIAFLMTAPIINPVVVFSTYIAFGNSLKFALLRISGALFVSLIFCTYLAFFHSKTILKQLEELPDNHVHHHVSQLKFSKKLWESLVHAVDEFFDTGRFLIFGALLASLMQVYIPTRFISTLATNKLSAILVLLLFAFVLSLCSEADAFIGSSLLSLFGTAPIVAFLIFGPMVDIKNILMMNRFFKRKFTLQFVGATLVLTTIFALFIG